MNKLSSIFYAVLLIIVSLATRAEENLIQRMNPSVVKTVPQAGDLQVDPTLKEVSVTFSKDMKTKKMWSWAMNSKDTFPEINADKIHFLKNKRTCVLPVKLKADKTYIIWVNSEKHNSFRDTFNNPAIPYLLVFHTAKKTSAYWQEEKAAVIAAENWLNMIDKGQYKESWDKTADFFKASVSRAQWPEMLTKIRKPLGKKVSRKLISKKFYNSLPGAPDGKYVIIQFQAVFENKKSAIETITPSLSKDGKWKPSGYFIK